MKVKALFHDQDNIIYVNTDRLLSTYKNCKGDWVLHFDVGNPYVLNYMDDEGIASFDEAYDLCCNDADLVLQDFGDVIDFEDLLHRLPDIDLTRLIQPAEYEGWELWCERKINGGWGIYW